MKVVVTGSAGVVGKTTAAHLASQGHDVLAIDRIRVPSTSFKSAVVDLCDLRPIEAAFHDADGVVHMARVPFPYASSGYDAASRTWHKPDVLGDAERFNKNLQITYNVFSAALNTSVRKLVIGSSLAAYGLYYPSRFVCPDYLPIDEKHPLRPDDPYGLTKQIGEAIADGFAARGSMNVISLRFPVIYAGDREKLLREQTTAIRGYGAFWTYLHAEDAAIGCGLALENDIRGHQVFNLCAPTTLTPRSTIDLVQELVPEMTDFRTTDRGNWAGYDTTKAASFLGFKAKHLITF